MREYEERPNDLCPNQFHWQSYVASIDLTPEERKIMESREAARQARKPLYEKLKEAVDQNNHAEAMNILTKIADSDNDVCEHGRSICKPCLACDELEAKIFGEPCDNCGDRPGNIIDGLCNSCQSEEE